MSSSDKYKVKWSTRFKKDYKLAMKRGYNIDLLDDVIHSFMRHKEFEILNFSFLIYYYTV